MKKVLILSGSPRKGGNSDLLCDEFLRGAMESGNEVTKIRVCEKKISPCLGCYACTKGVCIQKDDMAEILQAIIDTDVIVLASPVYFYSMNAQLKALIDRTVARWTEITNKEFYYIMTAGENEPNTMNGTLCCMRGFLECCEGSIEKGYISGGGVNDKGDVKATEYMKQAYEMGKSIK